MIGKSANEADHARQAHAAKLSTWRAENRRRLGLPHLPPYRPFVSPAAPKPPVPIPSPPPRPATPPPVALTAADLEFERVRAAAMKRQEAERAKRAEEDAAVAAILGALANLRA